MKHLFSALLLVAASLSAQELDWDTRGYQSRACGFDLDNDGIPGEAGDCDISSGATISGGLVDVGSSATDPDGDGQDEDIIYIDCDSGTDQAGCGADGEPACLTIEYAIENIGDGPSVGEEDIFVFKGTCSPDEYHMDYTFAGQDSQWTKTAEGNEHFNFEYPAEPAMLIGWDYDGDGEYPPHDTDDTSVLDGAGLNRAFYTCSGVGGVHNNHNIELAHFTVEDYNYITVTDGQGTTGGFIELGETNTYDCSHTYVHDLELYNIGRENGAVNGNRVFSLRMGGSPYVAIENVKMDHFGGYGFRGGSGNGTVTGPHRVAFVTGTSDPCDYDDGTPTSGKCVASRAFGIIAKLWGWITNIEYINSDFEHLGAESDTYYEGGLVIDGGQHNSWVTDNNFTNYTQYSINVDASTAGVVTRDTGPVYVERNNIVSTIDSGHQWSGQITTLANPASATETLTDFYIRNNFMYLNAHHSAQLGIKLYIGSNSAATRNENYIHNNTFNLDSPLIEVVGHSYTYNIEVLDIRNNVIIGTGSALTDVYQIDHVPDTSFVSDYNIFTDVVDADWRCAGSTSSTFAAWQASTCAGYSPDQNSDRCVPVMVNSPNDMHLLTGDTCAQEAGTSLSAYGVTDDYDQDARPQSSLWDIGADEYASGYTPEGACCDATCEITTEAVCTDWQGAGTTCSPDPCGGGDPVGYCCDDGCSVTTEASCSGVWGGSGTDCDPDPCAVGSCSVSGVTVTGITLCN